MLEKKSRKDNQEWTIQRDRQHWTKEKMQSSVH